MAYNWTFCKIGGVTRVKITSGKDIAHLDELDQKLWTVLSCPVAGLEFDEKTLALMDTNNDGKIRVNEVKAAAKWLTSVVKDPDLILKQEDTFKLSDFNQDDPEGKKLYDSSKQILSNLECDKDEITLAQASDSIAIFAKTALNGDGIVTEQSTKDEALKDVIASAIATVGSADDRSGLKGINTDLLDKFYAACADYKAWKDAGTPDIFPFGDDTAAALDACNAVKDKVSDYFMRCKLAAFNDASTAALDISAERIGQISSKDLTAANDEISAYPIARVTGKSTLPLDTKAINPAWQAAFAKVRSLVLDKEFPGASELSEKQWNDTLAKFSAYTAWNDGKKGSEVESLGIEKIEKLLSDDRKADLAKLIEEDKKLEAESNAIDSVEKFLRYYKNFYKLLKNFVTLTDFYSRDPLNLPVFQAGTLFIDQRSTELCINVADMGKQGEVSELSGMYILYCTCTSKVKNKTMTIAAVLTEGDVDNIRVGKNAVFYDREGHDWDAVVTKIVDNPISIRQAFWSPYKKLARFVYDKINKTATEKNSKVDADLTAKADNAKLEKPADAPAEAAEAAPADPNKVAGFDIAKFAGIFAAIGMAVGFIASALVSLAEGITAKWYNLPLLILAIIILVSGPSMFLAWQKLRKRNLAPVLNANGWAINSHILVNIPFGATFTSLAKYPNVNLEDPYAPKKMSVGTKILIVLLILAAGVAGLYFTGHINLITDHLGFLNPPAAESTEAPAADAAPAADVPVDAPQE
ncbi:MAG: hypothetical protein IJ165_06760 [Proteobacteria bacterium]|nr:hypothetical protein [Pseudomonadota bacterium]